LSLQIRLWAKHSAEILDIFNMYKESVHSFRTPTNFKPKIYTDLNVVYAAVCAQKENKLVCF